MVSLYCKSLDLVKDFEEFILDFVSKSKCNHVNSYEWEMEGSFPIYTE